MRSNVNQPDSAMMFSENADNLATVSCKRMFILLLVLMLAACGTTSKVATFDTDDIVISEEFGIDTYLSDKFKQAVIHINNKKYDDAIELLVEVTSQTDKHSAPYINLAIAYSETGKIKDAETILLKALTINPLHPVTNNELGLVYRKTGQFAKAKTTYEQVIKNYPQFLPARKNLGILCDLFMSDLNCAIEQYEAYLNVRPDEKEVSIWLADLKKRAGQ
ncbi:MAG: tetratricopeptide repeat protein [Gammaproteobacteria bacterium]|nr:tetratricopeptide repeat protein [Gammaproteobacteria bacterium]MCW8988209.1 tetratricopeptide repeat protein [Gammaproteobacteria bacterium]MCW9032159.1 tetratricopeptide repeat protein [Gammaproteobacteria bacterium]